MSKNVTICLRIDTQLKSESEAVLRQLGLTTSEAIKIFLSAVRNRKGLPFPVQLEEGQADSVPAERLPRRKSIQALRGQYRDMPPSDDFSRRKQSEINEDGGKAVSIIPLGDGMLITPKRLELDEARRRIKGILKASGLSPKAVLEGLDEEREGVFEELYGSKKP
ncbi:type II toxin-antitoxin system RelB/DinJ family antitoxin [Geobacter sp.]|uniref:type II toxin-antitoxin system RelB/DinJ family antitoxin n=1 Tax=Geobacter sp. TaxID=46610 RepID=UPI001AC101AF|nr:type II toxin-antitoxin system RelB/DinJ family antitoxin [Geobacter sp.]CAG1020409.1 hypothetical protein MTYM_00251 [Methylococcales bacterium]